jgi:hypothetical protein
MNSPLVRRKRLASEIRVLREAQGLNQSRSVLSVCHGLTVRCHDAHFTWEDASGEVRRHTYELIDVAEEVLRRHEELDSLR